MKMTNEEAIQELKDASDSEVRYGDTEHHYDEVMKRVEAFDMAIKAIEKVETYEKMMDELLEPKYGDYIQHKFTHEYGDVVTVEDLRYTFGEYRRDEE